MLSADRLKEVAVECGFDQFGVSTQDGRRVVELRAPGRMRVGINIFADEPEDSVRDKMTRAFSVAGYEQPS